MKLETFSYKMAHLVFNLIPYPNMVIPYLLPPLYICIDRHLGSEIQAVSSYMKK